MEMDMDQGMNSFTNAQQQQQLQQRQFKNSGVMGGPAMNGRVASAKEQTLLWQQGNWDSGIQSGVTTNAPSISSRASGLEMEADDDMETVVPNPKANFEWNQMNGQFNQVIIYKRKVQRLAFNNECLTVRATLKISLSLLCETFVL